MILTSKHTDFSAFYSGGYRYGYQGSEKDDKIKGEGNSYTTEFRQYDPRIGRWLSFDPVFKPHESPYAWNTNNPLSYNDPLGADSTQRAQAVEKAKEYVKKGTGTTYSYNDDGTGESGDKGLPGSSTDCSGLVSNCIVAGEELDPVGRNSQTATKKFGKSNGVSQIAASGEEISLNDLQVGSIVTFRNNGHVGIVSGNIIKDDNGNVIAFSVIQSASSTGPKEITISVNGAKVDGANVYWSPKLGKAYKWDTRPDITKKITNNEVNKPSNTVNNKTTQDNESSWSTFTTWLKRTFPSDGLGL